MGGENHGGKKGKFLLSGKKIKWKLMKKVNEKERKKYN